MTQFTVTEQALETHMFQKMPPNQVSVVKRIYVAGMKVLFSPQTHTGIMQELEKSLQAHPNDVSSVLGAEVTHLMILLSNESKGTAPGGALVCAGILLLAKGCEFLNSTNVVQMTDKIFGDAAHMLTVALQSKLNPSYNASIGAPPNAGTQPAAPTPPQPGGLLTQGAQ